MKIVILTVYNAPNQGSYLQAYAMQKYLESLGNEVYFGDYRKFIDKIKIHFIDKKAALSNPIYHFKKTMMFLKEQKRFNVISISKSIDECEKCIIGSDELWNVENDKYFRDEVFYGGKYDANNVLIYAVSCNEAEKENFSQDLVYKIKRLKNVTCRDEHTRRIIGEIRNENITFCCDPTFLVDKKIFLEKKFKGKLPKRFILIYSYGLDQEKIKIIKEYAKENDYKLVSVCNYNKWCDYNLNCTPLEFSTIIEKADKVITSTFHGSIFSILNEKDFVCVKDTPKMKDLLERLELKDAILTSFTKEELALHLNRKYDYVKVNDIIESYRASSQKVIRDFLIDKSDEDEGNL